MNFSFDINLGHVIVAVLMGLIAWWAKSMKQDIHDVKLSNARVENRLNELAYKVSSHETSLRDGNQRFKELQHDMKRVEDMVIRIIRDGCSRVEEHSNKGRS